MQNFEFNIGTDILFGKNQIEKLPEHIQKYGKRVLLVYGGGSIKTTGLYDKALDVLKDFTVFECSGVESNPKIDSVYQGLNLCREHQVQAILAIGGGSVIDCAKAIAAAVYYHGDVWDLFTTSAPIEKALPVFAVLTLAAAGSEINIGSVISNPKINEKRVYKSIHLRPKVAVLDPQYTFTVPLSQTAAGSIDILSHILEDYFTTQSNYIADKISEALMQTVIKYAPIAMTEPDNYEARAQIMWAGSLGDNGIIALGNAAPAYSCHAIEHEVSAYYDITHGIGLAIITPQWMHYVLSDTTVDRFAQYGTEVWGIDHTLPKMEIAKLAIEKTSDFFKRFGVPMTLSELEIDDRHFDAMAEHAVLVGKLHNGFVPLNSHDVEQILTMCL